MKASLRISDNSQVEWQLISSNRARRLLWEYTLLPISLKQKNVELFWGTHYFLPPVKVCKYIVTIHDLTSLLFPQYHSFFRRIHHKNSILTSVRLADYIIADSHSTKQDLMKLFSVPADKIKVIYIGVDSCFRVIKSQEDLLRSRDKYALPSEFIFTLGVLEPKKNTESVIRAYADLKKSLPNVPKLVIGGSIKYGWKNSNIFRVVSELRLKDDVIFTDFIDYQDLPAVYNLAKLFVFPSIYEGFGLPVLEAMACGTPVITSNTSSLPEVAGDAAVLVDPYDILGIADAISNVLADENNQREMAEKGLKNVKRFSWQKAAQEILEVFEDRYKNR
jgi:glycosyltransferase involved in cell wall biosynthesis